MVDLLIFSFLYLFLFFFFGAYVCGLLSSTGG